MKKLLILAVALLVLFAVAPVMAPAMKTTVTGEFSGIATDPGVTWTSEEGIIQIRDGAGAGSVTGDLPGIMTFTMNAAFDPTTGTGRAWGTFVTTDPSGNTFEGTWLMSISYWGNYIEGKSVAHGTGAYDGMILKNPFWGYNAYFGVPPYPDPPIYFEFDGTIISPQG